MLASVEPGGDAVVAGEDPGSDDDSGEGGKQGDVLRLGGPDGAGAERRGGGGGKPDMAQAGGKDPAKIEEAIEKTKLLVRQKLEGGS